MSKILLTGKNGQVGWELRRALAPLGEVIAFGREDMDLSRPDGISSVVRSVKPDLIVNAAAYTAVDQAESEPDLAMAINGTAPGILAEEAKRLGAFLVHYSTDYVFDGTKALPYTEEDRPNPLNVYGKTKLAGEQAIQASGAPHLIFRTSWVYGSRGKNFLLTILRLAREKDELRIVADQFGAPTWGRMIAEATAHICATFFAPHPSAQPRIAEVGGVYHLTAGGTTSWHDFAEAILGNTQNPRARRPHLIAIPGREYPLPARRPTNSLLSNSKLNQRFGLSIPDWRIGLALCLEELFPV